MAISIKNQRADRLARELAEATGESLTEAVIAAIEQRLEQVRHSESLADGLRRLVDEIAVYPVLDGREADEILGYDHGGLPS